MSLYIESDRSSVLFDMGQSDLFIRSAEAMKVDLLKTDASVISHGHYDHGGGLEHFLNIGGNTPVYVHRKAFEPHFALRQNGIYANIGLDPSFKENERVILTEGTTRISDDLILFENTTDAYQVPRSNGNLFVESEGRIRSDDFRHEQNLIVKEKGKNILITGCSHRGIMNIVAGAKDILGTYPNTVIGGFHLRIGDGYAEDESEIRRISEALYDTDAVFFTGHCTEESAYGIMEETMGKNIRRIKTGNILEL